jgi:hypothetical protein
LIISGRKENHFHNENENGKTRRRISLSVCYLRQMHDRIYISAPWTCSSVVSVCALRVVCAVCDRCNPTRVCANVGMVNNVRLETLPKVRDWHVYGAQKPDVAYQKRNLLPISLMFSCVLLHRNGHKHEIMHSSLLGRSSSLHKVYKQWRTVTAAFFEALPHAIHVFLCIC